MKWEEQRALFEKTMKEMSRILEQKGAEYAADEDAVANFKRGLEIGITAEQRWWTFAEKHWAAITQYIKRGKVMSEEPIEGRIHDMMNYLFLLLCLIEEKNDPIKDIQEAAPQIASDMGWGETHIEH